MRKVLEACPTCGGPLVVRELECERCQTQVRGRWSPCAFCALTDDQLVFVRLFVEKRGNLREMEKTLGVSYPTVRGKLEEIAARLSGDAVPGGPASEEAPGVMGEARWELLRQVAEGKLSAKEALARLRAQAGSQGKEGDAPRPGG